ncbi:hypothetical protein HT031_006742 [Scenedesmus sp. PABB004]|nr:hypothetical protein HT031_006742 [Scenedesmus sp. PABB004]
MLRSQWRWVQAVIAYVGPPSHVLCVAHQGQAPWPACKAFGRPGLSLQLPWSSTIHAADQRARARAQYPVVVNLAAVGLAVIDANIPKVNVIDGDTSVVLVWRLSGFMLALLISFKVNRSYERWWMGRQSFAGVGNAALSVATMATLWVPDPQLRAEIVRWAKIWHFSIYQLLTRQPLHDMAAALLSAEELAYYSNSVDKANLDLPKFLQLDGALTRGINDQGTCARIKFQAMPYALTLFCSGFLEVWLIFAAFAIIPDRSTARPAVGPAQQALMVPVFEILLYLLMTILMLGVDEIASQLEEPFPYMPLFDIAVTTWRDIERLVDESATLEALGSERLKLGGAAKAAPDIAGSGRDQDCTVVTLSLTPDAAAPDDGSSAPAMRLREAGGVQSI